uniref:MEQ protein n=1 Tax=Gallid alphaherpesvirus 2 TaxID=10390 RepID=C0KLZ3_9ALPH|nr:MEQ protein [Gallid alphaherpesvirus 2]
MSQEPEPGAMPYSPADDPSPLDLLSGRLRDGKKGKVTTTSPTAPPNTPSLTAYLRRRNRSWKGGEKGIVTPLGEDAGSRRTMTNSMKHVKSCGGPMNTYVRKFEIGLSARPCVYSWLVMSQFALWRYPRPLDCLPPRTIPFLNLPFALLHLPHRMNLTLHIAPVPNLLSVPPLLPIRRNFAPSSARPHHLPSLLPIYLRSGAFPPPTSYLYPPSPDAEELCAQLCSTPPPPICTPHSLFCPPQPPSPEGIFPALCPVTEPCTPPSPGTVYAQLCPVGQAPLFTPSPPHPVPEPERLYSSSLPRIPNRIPCIRARFIFSFPRIFSLRSGGFQVTGDP